MEEIVKVQGYSRVKTPCQANPQAWFSTSSVGQDYAKGICNSMCDFKDRCLRQALEDMPSAGVWGGEVFPL